MNAAAFQPASDDDKKPIQLLIDLAKSRQDDIDEAENRLGKVYGQIKEHPEDQKLKQSALEISQAISDFKKERDLDRDKAIHYALIAYRIVPADASDKPKIPSGSSVRGSYTGQNIYWRPIAEDDIGYSMPLPRGGYRNYPINKSEDVGGRTFPDGLSAIFAFAFQSPDFLAITLDHEKEHFDQITEVGRGDKLSQNEMEVEAWNKTIEDLSNPDLPAEFSLIWLPRAKERRDEYKAAVAREHSLMGWLLSPKDSDVSQFVFHDPKELNDVATRFDGLSDIVAREIQVTRVAAERQRIEADNERLRAILADIADRACAGFVISQSELEALPIKSDSRLLLGQMPRSIAGTRCASGLYMNMGIDLTEGKRPTQYEIQSIAGMQAQAESLVRSSQEMADQRAQDAEIVRASHEMMLQKEAFAAQNEAFFEQMRMDYVLNLKNLSTKACDSPEALSDYDAYSFGGILSYPGTFASAEAQVSAGMSGCAKGVFDRIVELARERQLGGSLSIDFVRQLGRYYAPAPDPEPVQPTPPAQYSPAPRRRPLPCHWVTVSLDGRKECW